VPIREFQAACAAGVVARDRRASLGGGHIRAAIPRDPLRRPRACAGSANLVTTNSLDPSVRAHNVGLSFAVQGSSCGDQLPFVRGLKFGDAQGLFDLKLPIDEQTTTSGAFPFVGRDSVGCAECLSGRCEAAFHHGLFSSVPTHSPSRCHEPIEGGHQRAGSVPDKHGLVGIPLGNQVPFHDRVAAEVLEFPSSHESVERVVLDIGHTLTVGAASNEQCHHKRAHDERWFTNMVVLPRVSDVSRHRLNCPRLSPIRR